MYRFAALAATLAVLAAACSGSSADEQASPTPAAAGSTQTPAPETTPGTAVDPERADPGPAEHDGARTIEHIRYLSETIGSRLSGTLGEEQAVEYIAARFRLSGYDVEVMPFEVTGVGPADLVVDGRDVDAAALMGSASDRVEGPAVWVGLGDLDGIGGRDLTGKIAFALRGEIRFSEKYANTRDAGAIALVVINNGPGLFSGTVGRGGEIPVVAVAGEDEQGLRSAAEAGVDVSLESGGTATAFNVIARPAPGATCAIIVGGHHDTVTGIPGATDNASGTAHTLELARAFAADGILDPGLCFATFGAEESGLNGSRALVERLSAEADLPAYMVNLDVTATGSRVDILGDVGLQLLAVSIAESLGVPARPTVLPANVGSDHQSFAAAGVPVIFLTADDASNIHTERDTADRVAPDLVEGLGDVAFALIAELQERVAGQDDRS